MNVVRLDQEETLYPSILRKYLGDHAPKNISAMGNLDLLGKEALALFCSVKCPGDLVLKTYDLAQSLREKGATTIGGFHSPMEQECLNILLRSSNPVIVCPARSLERMRMSAEYKRLLADGRLLFLSPFSESQRRATVEMALHRNLFVAALANRIFISYAELGGKTEKFCREVVGWGKSLYTFEVDANSNLIKLGAKALNAEGF